MRTVTLVLPLPPNVANARGHWAARRKVAGDWELLALATERKIRGRHEPMQRATCSAVFYVGRWVMDDDNCTARLKVALDLIRRRGLIVDDKRPHLTLEGIPEQRTTTPRRIELTLREVA